MVFVLGVLIYLLPNKSLDMLFPPLKFRIISELLLTYVEGIFILLNFRFDWVVKFVSGRGVFYKNPAFLAKVVALMLEFVFDEGAFMCIMLGGFDGMSGSKCYPCSLLETLEALVLPGYINAPGYEIFLFVFKFYLENLVFSLFLLVVDTNPETICYLNSL